MKKCFFISIISLGIFFLSCKKENSSADATLDLLTAKPWIVQKQEERINNSAWVDHFPFWAVCEKDNRWKFRPDLNLEFNESDIACSGNSPNAIFDIVTWSFADNQAKIIIENQSFYLMQLDENVLILTSTELVNGTSYETKLTLTH